MFKIFVIVFLASGGGPIATANGKHAYPTIEECKTHLQTTDASDPQSVAAYLDYVRAVTGQSELRVAATCAEVTEDGEVVNKDQLPSDQPQE